MRSYSLYIDNNKKTASSHKNTYQKRELEEMTTIQLREICTKEKIIKGIMDPLNRYELIVSKIIFTAFFHVGASTHSPEANRTASGFFPLSTAGFPHPSSKHFISISGFSSHLPV